MEIKLIGKDFVSYLKNFIPIQPRNYIKAKNLEGFPQIKLDDDYLNFLPVNDKDALISQFVFLVNSYLNGNKEYSNSNESSYGSVLLTVCAMEKFVNNFLKSSQGKYLIGEYDESIDLWVLDAIISKPKKSIKKIEEAFLPSLIITIFQKFLLEKKGFKHSFEEIRKTLFINFCAVYQKGDKKTYERQYNEFVGIYNLERHNLYSLYVVYEEAIIEFLNRSEKQISKISDANVRKLFLEFVEDFKLETDLK